MSKPDQPVATEEVREHDEERGEVTEEEGRKSIKAAADFLDEHHEHPGLEGDHTTKAAIKYHAKALHSMCKDMADGDGDRGDMDNDEDMSDEEKSLAKSLIASMKAQAAENAKLLAKMAAD